MSKMIVVVGAPGFGKTTVAKEVIKKHRNALAFDLYGYEYAAFPEVADFRRIQGHMKYTGMNVSSKRKERFQYLMDNIKYVQNSLIVVEDATTFLRGAVADSETVGFIVDRRHNNNTVMLLYHSLASIPPFVMEQTNYLILKKTNDVPGKINRKYEDERILAAFLQVRADSDKYATKILKLQ